MTKKFTEEEYQKIVGIANHLLSNRSVIELSTLDGIYFQIQNSSNADERNKFKELNQELALIALPKSRDWAHEQFVEPEKKYYWISKKRLPTGQYKFLWKNRDGLPYGVLATTPSKPDAFTEAEVHEACYDPDMFDKEEVE